MAAPSFVSVGSHLAGSGTSASVNPPAGTAIGRVVIVSLYLDGSELPITPASGFALGAGLPVSVPGANGVHTLYKWWKRCAGADVDPYVFTWSESRYREVEVTLWDDVVAAGDPWDPGADSAASDVNSTTTPPVEVTTAGPDRALIWSGTNWFGGSWTAPTGFTERFESQFGLVTEASMPFAVAGSTGPITGTCTSSDKSTAWLGALIGTTDGGGAVAAAGTSTTALSSHADARKVAAVTATTGVVALSTAAPRKVAPAAALSSSAVATVAGARKRSPASTSAPLAGMSVAVAAKRGSAAGVSAAVLWSYRSQVTVREVTAACSALVTGSASGGHVAATAGVASLTLAGRAVASRMSPVTGRAAAAVAAQARSRKVTPASGTAYLAAAALQVVPQDAPDLVGVITASDRPQARLTAGSQGAATMTSTTSGGDG